MAAMVSNPRRVAAALLLGLGSLQACAGTPAGVPAPAPAPATAPENPAPAAPAPAAPVAAETGTPALAPGFLVVRKWLALDAVDDRWRVPFNANAPFLEYLLDRAAPPPKEGETVKGAKAEAAWRPVEARPDGTLEDETGGWVSGEVEAPREPAEAVYLAHLDGAAVLFVNGAGFVGDVYRGGFGPVPVALAAGTNRLFVAGPRGPWRLQFEAWAEGRSPILTEDATLPDLVQGEDYEGRTPELRGAVRIVHPSTAWADFWLTPWIDSPDRRLGLLVPTEDQSDPQAPLFCGKVGFGFWLPKDSTVQPGQVRLPIRASLSRLQGTGTTTEFPMEVRDPHEARRITFPSGIDGAVQSYAVLPPSPRESRDSVPPGTVLTLHGAGVDALAQARAYSSKPDFRIVAPTNRRPFGFDWEDWGETDAMEVLLHCQFILPGDIEYDLDRVFLTGHSMGGHGVWHLAAKYPDAWTAIAPSAGWCSFDTYGGGPRPESPLSPIWRACDGGSRTEDLIANLVPLPTFVLHGTKDDNVPLSEAQAMLERLEKAGGKPLHHFQEGAGHWWDGDASPGVDCVDWPGIFEFFRKAPPRAPKGGPPSAPGTGAPARGTSAPAGPFKRAFDNRFLLVVGTKGTEEENREMLELARYHSEQWWYRANGNAPVIRDTDLLSEHFEKRNLVLYGNADTNAAWETVLPAACPLKARRGSIALGDREWKGDSLGAVFVQPRRDDAYCLVGAFASTGARGTRVGYGLLPFVSGVGYPDYAVFGEEVLRTGDGGVLAAGLFDGRWALQAGGFVRGVGR